MKGNISFVICVYNEEKRIGSVIKNFINYGEVVVLDDGSTDNTKAITESLGAKFYIRPKSDKVFLENQEMYDFIKTVVKTDWIYWGFADNLMPRQLLEKLVELSHQKIIKYVYLPIHTFLWGNVKSPILKGAYPNFFMKDMVDFSLNKIHGLGRFLGNKEEILRLPDKKEFAIRHYSLYDLNKFVVGHLRYANAEAQQKFSDGNKFSAFYLVGGMLRYFFMYFKRGFRTGSSGLIVSLCNMFFRFMVYARLYELENNITLDNIEASYLEDKLKLLNEIEHNV